MQFFEKHNIAPLKYAKVIYFHPTKKPCLVDGGGGGWVKKTSSYNFIKNIPGNIFDMNFNIFYH